MNVVAYFLDLHECRSTWVSFEGLKWWQYAWQNNIVTPYSCTTVAACESQKFQFTMFLISQVGSLLQLERMTRSQEFKPRYIGISHKLISIRKDKGLKKECYHSLFYSLMDKNCHIQQIHWSSLSLTSLKEEYCITACLIIK